MEPRPLPQKTKEQGISINFFRGVAAGIFILSCGLFFPSSSFADPLKPQAQADLLEDKAAQAIDEGNTDQGLSYMSQAVLLDPTPLRRMNYGSMLFGNGVSVFKDTDPQKGDSILRQAEDQLRTAIQGLNPVKDQVYLSQCYFLLGEMYSNAFGDLPHAKAYYQKAAALSDFSGAKEALGKLNI